LIDILLEKTLITSRFLHFTNQTSFVVINSILELDLHFPEGHSARDFNKEPESDSAVVSDKHGNQEECIMRVHFQRT